MNEMLISVCDEFLNYRDMMKDIIGFFSDRDIFPVCSYVFLSRREEPNEELIRLCRQILRENSGVFSGFRGNGEPVFAAMLSVTPDPGAAMECSVQLYEEMRSYKLSSEYLPLLCLYMISRIPPEEYGSFAYGTYELFRTLNEEHPILTSSEDVVFAGLLHATGRNHADLHDEISESYDLLKESLPFLYSSDSIQTISHVLTLCSSDPVSKVERTVRFRRMLRDAGYKYGNGFEMSLLAIIANIGIDHDQILADFEEADDYLLQDKAYSSLFGHGKRFRYMHDIMILTAYYMCITDEQTAAVIIAVLYEIKMRQAAAAAAAA